MATCLKLNQDEWDLWWTIEQFQTCSVFSIWDARKRTNQSSSLEFVKAASRNLITGTVCCWVNAKKEIHMVCVQCCVHIPLAIHIVAHLFNLERYHLSQSEEAPGLPAALSKLGNSPNESYLNPIRTFSTVSSCMLTSFSSHNASFPSSLSQEHYISNVFNKRSGEKILPKVLLILSFLSISVNTAESLWAMGKYMSLNWLIATIKCK